MGRSDPSPPWPPDRTGTAVRDGVRIPYAVHGESRTPTVVLLPTWSIVPSRIWKHQVPTLARDFRVVTIEGRGSPNGDQPRGPDAYLATEMAADVLAVMDEVEVTQAVLVGFSMGGPWAARLAAEQPERVSGLVLLASSGGGIRDEVRADPFDARHPDPQGWEKYNLHHWTEGGWHDFVRFFFDRMFPEPHSTKPLEDAIRWADGADPLRMVDTILALQRDGGAAVMEELCRRVQCPTLVVEGRVDRIRPWRNGERLAAWTGGRLVVAEGSGHAPHVRDPVMINRLLKEFVLSTDTSSTGTSSTGTSSTGTSSTDTSSTGTSSTGTTRTWVRARSRPRRALYLSSPIGLGHCRRDLAVAGELRRHHPDLEIGWLTQEPVTRVLRDAGERVHPACAWLANESSHIEEESGEHDLHAFQAIRRMDEIMVNNFMVFADVVEEGSYDLVVGDEAWDVDYFLHENPELKRFSFAWMTDFVGWVPMPDGGAEEEALTTDYNAEMIEQRARYRRVRDASVFVGSAEDVVDLPFGPGLPGIRAWTKENFDFAGYVTGFVPPTEAERAATRRRLRVGEDDLLCVVTVGGSGVGGSLLRRVLDAVPAARRLVPDLHFLVVTGPRLDPASLPRRRGVTYRGYLPDLYRELAACDLAVVQGGLTTCMELAAADRPFLYVPLQHHFEQNVHVRHRLERYGAGTCVEYADASDPDHLAEAMAKELRRETRGLAVETDGAARAALLLAQLL
ncbi:alpha/beta fold hydrolase [Ornithinimicrobium sp. F0845]|uniref:alpha/beta hydrolase n=1 Tax=Ornithinimicrobium sp. F0845 TaxID=2926412 RepID=UPI001FF5B9A6|nr:alpha/beta fold hydrolase [Ornithinimicrobium sp. F0845]